MQKPNEKTEAWDKYLADFGEPPRVPTPDEIAAKTLPTARRGAPSGPPPVADGSFPDTHGGSSASGGGDGTGVPSGPDPAAAAREALVKQKHKRAFVEFCCGPNSILGQKAPDDTFVVRLTEQEDLTTQAGVKYATGWIKHLGPPTPGIL